MKKIIFLALFVASYNIPLAASSWFSGWFGSSQEPDQVLIDACENNDVASAQWALKNGADATRPSLPYLAQQGRAEILELVVQNRLSKNLPLDEQTDKGETALYVACDHGYSNIAEYLADNGANPFLTISTNDLYHTKNDTALTAAAKKCPRSTMERIIAAAERSYRQGAQYLLNTTNQDGRSCLHVLCRDTELDLDKLNLLLQKRVDVNLQDANGDTPFHAVCGAKKDKSKQLTAINLFMQHGADAEIADRYGTTGIQKAGASRVLLDLTNQRAIDKESAEGKAIIIAQARQAKATVQIFHDTQTHQKERLAALCAICQAEDTEPRTTINCNHSFHTLCLAQWTAAQKSRDITPSCALCRSTDLRPKQLPPIPGH